MRREYRRGVRDLSFTLVAKRFPEARVRRSMLRILGENVLCSIATVSRPNRAHINTAYFCYSDDLDLYFLSDPTSRHCRNLSRNPSMAMTVFASTQTWGGSDRGLQFFGTGRVARGRVAVTAEREYAKRFPTYAEWMMGRTEQERHQAALLRTYRFYRFRPDKVKILDEEEFGGGPRFVTATIRRPKASG